MFIHFALGEKKKRRDDYILIWPYHNLAEPIMMSIIWTQYCSGDRACVRGKGDYSQCRDCTVTVSNWLYPSTCNFSLERTELVQIWCVTWTYKASKDWWTWTSTAKERLLLSLSRKLCSFGGNYLLIKWLSHGCSQFHMVVMKQGRCIISLLRTGTWHVCGLIICVRVAYSILYLPFWLNTFNSLKHSSFNDILQ